MKISDFLSVKTIKIDMEKTTKNEALEELVDVLVKAGKISKKDNILKALFDREALGTTGIGQGIAIPHAKSDEVDDILAVLGISQKGVEFNSLDGEPVHIIFVFVSPVDSAGKHLKVLAKASQLLRDRFFREPLKEAKSANEVIEIIKDEE